MSKVVMFASCEAIAQSAEVLAISSVSIDALATLMVDAYQGTVDWEEGDDAEVAALEIRATIAGKYGSLIDSASGAILGEFGQPVSALFASNFDGRATILFVFTSKSASGLGYATKLIGNAAHEMAQLGIKEVFLYVSPSNPARGLYEHLGFSEK